MGVRSLKQMATFAWLASLALPLSAQSAEIPPRKVEINKFTCAEFSALESGEGRDRVLIYMNGYLDGTRQAKHWEADQAAKRIDEVVRTCKADPKLSLLAAFKRAWSR
jgi:hypothetical protein